MHATQPEETRRDRLERLRDRLEGALSGEVPVRDFAALSREYRACLADIAALPDVREVSIADEIAERRRKRQAGANVQSRAQHSS